MDDATASDVRQGNDGDCWFLSALCAIGNKKGLIDRVCVAKDELVGVYGFVFHRGRRLPVFSQSDANQPDGEWTYTLIDDKLYLNSSDYNESQLEKFSWDQVFNRQDAEEEYRKAFQTGSRALYFAQCSNEHETWLPLLEKAFAKAHGDYEAINGGFTGLVKSQPRLLDADNVQRSYRRPHRRCHYRAVYDGYPGQGNVLEG